MELQLALGRTGRLGPEVYHQLREAILDGRLAPGQPLPATRALAERLAVSRNTVLGAYERLRAEGFLSGRAGSGTYVAEGIAARAPRAPAGADLRPRAAWRELSDAAPPTPPAPFDFRLGSPDPRLFPGTPGAAWSPISSAAAGRRAATLRPRASPACARRWRGASARRAA